MSLNLLKKKIQENRLYYLLFSLLISYQLVFEIIFYYDKVLINLDTYLEFLQLENYYDYGKQIIKVWPGSVVNLDKYNLFTFFSVFLDNFFFKIFDINIDVYNFIIFQIFHKFLIIIFIFFLLNYIFKSKFISLLGIFLIIIDGSFSHTLHNTHRYLISGLLLCYGIIIFKTKIKYSQLIKSFLIGFLFTFSCLSIVVTGLIVGISGVIFILYLKFKKKISLINFVTVIIGASFCLAIFINLNIENILDYISSKNLSVYSENKINYTIKYVILNSFYLIFNQHGNNFIIIYLITIFIYSFKKNFNLHNKLLLRFIIIFLTIFFLLGSIIDPVHYYPSRLGILTPFLILLFLNIIFKHSYLIKKNSTIFLFLLVANFCFIILKGKSFNPDTLELLIKTLIFSSSAFLLFYFLIYKKIFDSQKIIIILFGLTTVIKFYPQYKIDNIVNFFDTTRTKFINQNIEKNINTNSCIYSNYPYEIFFSQNTVYSMLVSGEHINKKNVYSREKCNNLVLINNNHTNNQLSPFIKMHFLKSKEKLFNLKKNNVVFFRDNHYSVLKIVNHKNITIFYANKFYDSIENKKIIYLSQY